MKRSVDVKSFLIGALSMLFLISTISASADIFSRDEAARLRKLAKYIQPDGNLNIGDKRSSCSGHRFMMMYPRGEGSFYEGERTEFTCSGK